MSETMVLNSSVMNLLALPKSINSHIWQAALIFPINEEAKWAARPVKFLLAHVGSPAHLLMGNHNTNPTQRPKPSLLFSLGRKCRSNLYSPEGPLLVLHLYGTYMRQRLSVGHLHHRKALVPLTSGEVTMTELERMSKAPDRLDL